MRISKSDDPFRLDIIDCGHCGTKFSGERCISTSVAAPRGRTDVELLCVSIIAAGLLAGAIETPSESASVIARDLFKKIKKEIRK